MKLVVDASVAIKWAVEEDHRREARLILERSEDLVAPAFLTIEVANILWKKVRLAEVTAVQAKAALPAVTSAFSRLVPTAGIVSRALELALELDHPIYDCLYIATAEAEGTSLISADARLLKAVEGTALERLVLRLGGVVT